MKQMINSKLLIWLGIWILFACVCHSAAAYHFYYMEQWSTFYWEVDAVCQTLSKPGGLCLLVADFLMQFFCYGAGPVVFALLMTLAAYAQSLWLKEGPGYLGCITAVAMLMTLTSNMACLLAGSVCLTMVMFLMAVVFRCRMWLKIVALALIVGLVRKEGLVREGTELNGMVCLPWITAGVVFVLQLLYRYVRKYIGRFHWVAQLLLVAGACAGFFLSCYRAQDEYMKKIYYYVRHQQWDEIINRSNSRGSKGNITFQLCRNMALAQKGELGEKFLMYEQSGMGSVFSSDMKNLQGAMVLMDVYYTMGYVNMTQLCAFESQECMENKSPYLWQRLVDTNLENGAYAVAEKYIKILERTLAYRDWAMGRRKFLYNDRAVNQDPVLGLKRKCIPKVDGLIGDEGFDKDLERIVEACPEHRASLEYLGVMYIVANQQGDFLRLMKRYEGTKAMSRVPASFAKAIDTFQRQATESIKPLL